MSLLGNIWVKLGLKSDDFNKGLDNAEKKSKTFGETMRGVAAKVTAVVAAFKMLAGTVKTITNFEASVSKLAAVLGTTVDKLGRMTDSAIELGRTTQYTASEVVGLQTELAKLGFAEPEILAMQESVLKFAAAVGTDLPSAAARAGATMRGFGLTAEETTDMLNVMAVSTSKSALSFNYLDSTLGKLVPVAKSFGLNTEGTIALLGTLANAGIDAGSAGTALRNIMLKLADSSSDLNKQLGGQPKTTEELIKAFEKLREKEIGLDEAAKLVDMRSASMFLTLVNGASDINDLYKELGNANGALDEMYETMTHNVQGAVKEVQSAWEGFILSLRGSTGILYTVLTNVRDLIGELNYALFQSAKESTQTSRYYDELSRRIAETGDKAGALEIAYKQLLGTAQAKVADLEGKSALGRLLNHDSLEEAKAEVTGLTAAYKQLKGELAAPKKTTTAPAPGGDTGDDPFAALLNSINKDKTKDKTDALAELNKEVREYAQEVKDANDYDEAMRETGRQLLEQWEEAHPAIDKTTQDLIALGNATAQVVEKGEKMKQQWEDICDDMADALRNGVVSAFDELAEAIGSGDWDISALLKALLNPLADTAISAGVLVSGIGTAIEGFKKALTTLNGPVAIAAGAALIAAGVAVKAGLAALASSGSKATGTPGGSDSYSYAGGYGVTLPQGTGQMELVGTVTVKGQDLQIALDNYNRNRGR
jgi:TP901 family phage tail tape measure protein